MKALFKNQELVIYIQAKQYPISTKLFIIYDYSIAYFITKERNFIPSAFRFKREVFLS
jgi:hypothetical protein